MRVPVAGVAAMHIDLGHIAVGDPVVLVAEPHSPHDANAIRVEHGGRLIGYLQRELAARLAVTGGLLAYRAAVAEVLHHEGRPAGLRLDLRRRSEVTS